jgi:predicted  nucleic acid-binding Zn-ribbon protein
LSARDKATNAKNQAARHTENAFEAASTCQDEKDAEKIVQEYNQARSKIYESEDHAQSIKKPLEEMQTQSKVHTEAKEKARQAIDDIARILSSENAQYGTVFEKVKAAKDQWAELESKITLNPAAINKQLDTAYATCIDDPDTKVEFEALKIDLKHQGQIDKSAIDSVSKILPEAEKLTPDFQSLRQKNNAIGRSFTGGKSTCDLSESFVEMVAQIPKGTRKQLASMVPFLRQKKQECSAPSEEESETEAETESGTAESGEEEEEGDPTEDDEWAKGSGRREGSRRGTNESGSGGQSGTTTGFSHTSVQAEREEQKKQLVSSRKPGSSKSKNRRKKEKPSGVTSSVPSSETPDPATKPKPGSSPVHQPSEEAGYVLYDKMDVPFGEKVPSNKVLKNSTTYKLVISGTVSIWPDKPDGIDAAYCYAERCSKEPGKKVSIGLLRYNWGSHHLTVILSNRVKSYDHNNIYKDQITGQGRKLEAELRAPYLGGSFSKHRSGSIKIKILEHQLK